MPTIFLVAEPQVTIVSIILVVVFYTDVCLGGIFAWKELSVWQEESKQRNQDERDPENDYQRGLSQEIHVYLSSKYSNWHRRRYVPRPFLAPPKTSQRNDHPKDR